MERDPLSHHQDSEDSPEEAAVPYYLARRFRTEPLGAVAYRKVRDLIYGSNHELSVYRFQLSQIFHVAVIGTPPPEPFEQRIRRLLSSGDRAELPHDILSVLYQRRAEASRHGAWIERHFGPGQST